MQRLILLLVLVGCNNPVVSNIGNEYKGAIYAFDPLGEDASPDLDPLIRTDAFDCTTFVETALAGGNVDKLTEIRYKNGEVSFLNRNHFIETDWLPNNSALVENVSSDYALTATRIVTIDKKSWLKKVHGIESDFQPVTVSLDYIPYSNLKRIESSEPLIVLFITGKSEKSDKIGTDIAVVHMGFLLPNGMLRHASSQYGFVMDTDFYKYAANRAKNKDSLGVMLVRIK